MAQQTTENQPKLIKLYVGNLQNEFKRDELQKVLGEYGTVVATIIKARSVFNKEWKLKKEEQEREGKEGEIDVPKFNKNLFAIVKFSDLKEGKTVESVVAELNGKKVDGVSQEFKAGVFEYKKRDSKPTGRPQRKPRQTKEGEESGVKENVEVSANEDGSKPKNGKPRKRFNKKSNQKSNGTAARIDDENAQNTNQKERSKSPARDSGWGNKAQSTGGWADEKVTSPTSGDESKKDNPKKSNFKPRPKKTVKEQQ